MLPGEVQSDEQAFRQILGRLEGDVGTILQLIPEGKKKGLFPNTAPLWALVRMTFPIAESVGDLIYQKDSTVNLKSVLETEFEAVRPGYQGKAAILTLLFRHSLIHTDELRTLVTGGKEIRWLLSWSAPKNHLKLFLSHIPWVYGLHFDTTAFYEDLVKVCRKAMDKQCGGQVMKRYNAWLTLNLDKTKQTRNVKDAISEIGKL
jgi:hypothetical protein